MTWTASFFRRKSRDSDDDELTFKDDTTNKHIRGIALVDNSGNIIIPNLTSPATDMEGGGKVSVGTTAVEVTFTGTPKKIIISADTANTGVLYWGESNVTNLGANAMGFLLKNDVLVLDFDDVSNAVYVVSDTASQNFWKGAILA